MTWTGSLRYGFFRRHRFFDQWGLSLGTIRLWPGFDRYVLFLLVFVGLHGLSCWRSQGHAHPGAFPYDLGGNPGIPFIRTWSSVSG